MYIMSRVTTKERIAAAEHLKRQKGAASLFEPGATDQSSIEAVGPSSAPRRQLLNGGSSLRSPAVPFASKTRASDEGQVGIWF